MFRGKRRFGKNPGKVIRSKTTFDAPVHWKKPRMIFTCSWSDWFIEEADGWRSEAWDIIRKTPQHIYQILTKRPERIQDSLPEVWGKGWDNVWLGVSIENQDFIFRKNILKSIPAKIRFISAEPLLGPIIFDDLLGIHWMITGGESGPNSREMKQEWAISIMEQCKEFTIPFFHKQNGGSKKLGNAWGGRMLKERIWNDVPGKS
jgi:protein gp37